MQMLAMNEPNYFIKTENLNSWSWNFLNQFPLAPWPTYIGPLSAENLLILSSHGDKRNHTRYFSGVSFIKT